MFQFSRTNTNTAVICVEEGKIFCPRTKNGQDKKNVLGKNDQDRSRPPSPDGPAGAVLRWVNACEKLGVKTDQCLRAGHEKPKDRRVQEQPFQGSESEMVLTPLRGSFFFYHGILEPLC